MFSCHSHSGQYCLHAHGTLDELVQKAIDHGFTSYCLTEHMPRSRAKDLYPEEQHLKDPVRTKEIYKDFYEHARRLQKKYKDTIHLLVGFESEWIHRGTLDDIRETMSECPPDVIVGSVHHVFEFPLDFDFETYNELESWVQNQPRSFASNYLDAEELSALGWSESSLGSERISEAQLATEIIFRGYFDAQYELLTSVKPTIVGHFDLCRLFRPNNPLSTNTWKRIHRNLEFICSYGGLVEVNSRAYKKKLASAYPFRDILSIIVHDKRYKDRIRLTCSDDSHGEKDVGMSYGALWEYLNSVGVEKVYYPVLVGEGASQEDANGTLYLGKEVRVQSINVCDVKFESFMKKFR